MGEFRWASTEGDGVFAAVGVEGVYGAGVDCFVGGGVG